MRMRIKPLSDGTTEIDIKLIEDGRALIHWLKEDGGPIHIKGHQQLRQVTGQLVDGKYTIVCNPKQTTVSSQKRGSIRYMCMTTTEFAAVTCPKCLGA